MRALRGHTGTTPRGNTRDMKVERLGGVTIYKRGKNFYLYYREIKRTVRRRVDGNLATARLVAGHVNTALAESRPSPLGFQRIGRRISSKAFSNTVSAWRVAAGPFPSFSDVRRRSPSRRLRHGHVGFGGG